MNLNTPPPGQLAVSTALTTANSKAVVADGTSPLVTSSSQPADSRTKSASTTVLTLASPLPIKVMAESEVVIARVLSSTLLPAISTNQIALTVKPQPLLTKSTEPLDENIKAQVDPNLGKHQQTAPNRAIGETSPLKQTSQKQWVIELQLPSKSGLDTRVSAISEKSVESPSIVLLRPPSHSTDAAREAKSTVSKLIATPISIEIKVPRSSANEILASLQSSGSLIPAKVKTVKILPGAEAKPTTNTPQPVPAATNDKLNHSAQTPSTKPNIQVIHVESIKISSETKLQQPANPVGSQVQRQTPETGEKLPEIAHTPKRWLLDVTVTGPKGVKQDLQLVLSKPIPALTDIAIDISAASEKSNTQKAFSQITTIISESLQTAQLEGKPITQLAKLNTAILASSQSEALIGAKNVQNLQELASFGIKKESNIRELVDSLGVFAKKDKVPLKTEAPTPQGKVDNRPADVNQNLLKPTNGLSSIQNEAKPEQTVKEQVATLIGQLMTNSAQIASTANSARGNTDPLLILIELLSKPIAGGQQAKGGQETSDAQVAREQAAKVLKQVLLGIQGSSVRNLAEKSQDLDRDTQQNSILNIELPIHWSNSTGKTIFKVHNRDGWHNEESDDGTGVTKSWQFELTMDFPGDRVMTTRCTLNNQRARLQIWASTAEFKKNIEHRLQSFKTKLEKDGIALDYCGCALGAAPNNTQSGYFQKLVDTKA